MPTRASDLPVTTSRETAAALRLAVSTYLRRARARRSAGELSNPELSVLARVDRFGPVTIADLAREQQVTPQGMGATVAVLESGGLVVRTRDPEDGRRSLFTSSDAGRQALRSNRSALVDAMATAMDESFTATEIDTLSRAAALLERLADLI